MSIIFLTGASRGIGLALTEKLLGDGHTVIATCRTPAKAEALQALAGLNDKLAIYALDVTSEESIVAAKEIISAEYPTIDVLINNAGVLINDERYNTIKADDMRFTFEVNVIGPMMVSKHFVSLLKDGANPRLLNISSQLGSIQLIERGRIGELSYNASKAAINMLTRMVSHELKGDGITVVTVHPGWVQTDMGGKNAHTTPVQSATGLAALIDRLTIADTNKFFTFEGVEHAW